MLSYAITLERQACLERTNFHIESQKEEGKEKKGELKTFLAESS
jgi:hypothetical protein